MRIGGLGVLGAGLGVETEVWMGWDLKVQGA